MKHIRSFLPYLLLVLSTLIACGLHSTSDLRVYYTTPLLEYRDAEWTQQMNGEKRTYLNGNSSISFEPQSNGTIVTIEFFPQAPKTFRIFENCDHRKVFSDTDELLLEGQWGQGKEMNAKKTAMMLLDPATGEQDMTYQFEKSWTTPTASNALLIYELEKEGANGRGSPLGLIIALALLCELGIFRTRHPRRTSLLAAIKPDLAEFVQSLNPFPDNPAMQKVAQAFFILFPLIISIAVLPRFGGI